MVATAIPGLDVEELFPRADVNVNGLGGARMARSPIAVPSTAPVKPAVGMVETGTARPRASLRSAGKLGAAGAMVGAMAPSFDDDSTARYARRFGVSEPTGDSSVGDIAKFAGLRTLGYASDLGSALTFGLANKLYKDAQPDATTSATTAPAGAAPSAPVSLSTPSNPTDQRLAAGLQRPPSALPYIRNGNSFTDAGGGVQDGLRIGITPGMTDEAYAREARAREINGQMAETQKQLDNATAPTPGMTGFRTSRLADPGGSSILGPSGGGIMRPRDVRHAQDVALQRELTGLRERGEMERAQLGANTTMSAAQLGAQTQRDINERNVALGLRGQDMTLAGHRMANDVARAQMMRQMYESERSFAAGRDDANFTQGEAAQKALHEQIANMLPPITVDGKPAADTATAARYMGSLNSLVGNRMELLKQHLRLNPNDQQAASELAGLQRRGVASIPQDQVRRLVVGQHLADIAAATHTGWPIPYTTTAKASTKPVEWIKEDPSDSDFYITDRGDRIPKRYVDKEGSTLGFGGKQQLDFNVLKVR